jgi:asparagine synthase (glutamine-hydrolysing)
MLRWRRCDGLTFAADLLRPSGGAGLSVAVSTILEPHIVNHISKDRSCCCVPGLCGIVQTVTPALAGRDDLAAMLDRLCRFEWHVASRVALAGVSLGHVAVTPAGGTVMSGLAAVRDLSVAFDGELYVPHSDDSSWAARVAEGLSTYGPSFFADVHGCFSCAVWDAASRRLSIATDRFGMRPVYWTHIGEQFLFASEPGALLQVDGVSTAVDEAGLAQFLGFGQLLGNMTLHAAIRVVPAASWLTFDAVAGSVTVQPYIAADQQLPARSDTEWLELIDDRSMAAVARACDHPGSLGLSLSGGLDARTILGLAPNDAQITCVSLGIPGSIDHRAAHALAERARQPHHELMLGGDFLGRFEELLRQMVDFTDGQYLDQGIVLSTLPTYRDLGIQTLLRGHAGELMHMSKAYAFSLDEPALRLKTKGDLVDWLWRHLTGYMIGTVDDSQFTGPFGSRLRDRARAALEQQVSVWDHIEPVPQRIWRLFVAERLRRETALSLQLFRNFVEVRVPFLDAELVESLLAAPPHLKVRDTLQEFMLHRHRPSFLEVVNANTGAPMGAGTLKTRVASFRMKVYAKLAVPGYQPYERLGLWLARDLKPLVHRTLLSDRFLARGLFAPDAVGRIVSQHEARTHNHTFLIMAMLIFEIAQQVIVERGHRGEEVT